MKRVKIMLLSLALFAVVGATMAFKAKFGFRFCTAEYTGSCAKKCVNLITSKTTTDVLPEIVCTTTATTTFQDPGNPQSPIISTCTTFNGQANVNPDCHAVATITLDN